MNCANHPEQTATGFCRNCGKPLCQSCQRPAQGTIFCEEHFPVTAGTGPSGASQGTGPQAPPPYPPPPYPPPPPGSGATADNPWTYGPGGGPASATRVSPGLAFILGFIPGVGAVYNGQYAKGLIHAVVFGLLVSIESSGAAGGMEALFGILIAAWTFYMCFEAYHTAARRQRGEVVDEFSSILPLHGPNGVNAGFPVDPVIMIALGVVFLLNTLDLVRLRDILRFWPVFLIGLGGYMLWARLAGAGRVQEVGRE